MISHRIHQKILTVNIGVSFALPGPITGLFLWLLQAIITYLLDIFVIIGYNNYMNGKKAAEVSEITYRQLDYWVRSGIIKPTGPGQRGIDREFTDRDIAIVKIAAEMRDKKISLLSIHAAIERIPDTWQPSEGGFLIGKTKLYVHPLVFDPPRKNYVLHSVFKVIMWEYLSVEIMNLRPIHQPGNLVAEGMHKYSMVGYVLDLSKMQLISIKKNEQMNEKIKAPGGGNRTGARTGE